MSPEEQEARSRFHTGFWVVPLRSGRLGYAAHPLRELVGIASTIEEAAAAIAEYHLAHAPPPLVPSDLPPLDLTGIDL